MTEYSLSFSQAVALGVFVCIMLLEVLFPFRKYLLRLSHYGRNAVWGVINALLLAVFGAFINISVFLWIDHSEFGLLQQLEIPLGVSVLLGLLGLDAWTYFLHRLHHACPSLWRFHQVHHSDIQMDSSTAFRFHPGEVLVYSVFYIVFFIPFGITIEMMALYKTLFFVNVVFHHSNIRLPKGVDRLGRFLIVSPNMHRVHHSKKMIEANSNFASGLSIWDRIFGKYCESDPDKIVLGLEYDRSKSEQTLRRLLSRPFRK